MTFSLISHLADKSTNNNTFTSTSLNTTGANLIVVSLSDLDGTSVLTDSLSNTWISAVASTITGFCTVYYAKSPSVGAAQTFTVTCTGKFPSITVSAWSGADTAPLDQTNAASNSGIASLQTGSVTPTLANELVIAGVCFNDSADFLAIDAGFTVTDSILNTGGFNYSCEMGYLVETTIATVNPTWSKTSPTITGAAIATFKPAGSSPPQTPFSSPIVTQAIKRASFY